MKWENRDINIVWWEFRKFRKLNHRVTPLRLLKLFFECLLAAPSYTVIEREREREREREIERETDRQTDREQILVLKLLMKKIPYS